MCSIHYTLRVFFNYGCKFIEPQLSRDRDGNLLFFFTKIFFFSDQFYCVNFVKFGNEIQISQFKDIFHS